MEGMQIAFGLLGGLAVFIYGMNMMSECLQKAAGEKMKSILAMLTRNPLLGVLAGALTTAVLQSHHGYGYRLCQRGADEPASGDFDYSGCQYRYHHDGADYRL